MQKIKRKYGYLRDKHDPRDFLFRSVHAPKTSKPLPDKVSLRDKFKELPYDQGELGACSAHAALGIFTFEHGGGPWSRLELYYQERLLEGTVEIDSGAYLRDAIQVLNNTGVGLEADWPYDISKFKEAPPPKEMQEAAENKIVTYSRLLNGDDYKTCLADGYPFMIGIQIYKSFESSATSRTGLVAMPKAGEECLGGHAVCVIGYNQTHYEVRNSWGTEWGDHGHFWIPKEYLEDPNLASDAWTIRK